ncbi:type VI secretion system Vgr family protein [sulfur-oxidizing endosymbiont of Gigantopelta aegis]|uniref:type VI secretion system Vgr family protein n=1 Tax=sulfur-oxidizing endosymbiont of Gigantopelta aegis TaxID=2794934 RepID=UPI0018DDBDB0|nr:type VI secretion system tip protein TssI/VgrG [sulfur-oxidizing endosymbiont of Gigantopelta aegis]
MPYTSANTSRFTFSIANQASLHNKLRVYQFDLSESISDHFYLHVDFVCDDQNLDHSALIKKTALLTIQGEDEVQYLNGIIAETQCIENGTRFARYRAKVVPMAWFLEYRKGCRIFQNLSVQDIIKQIFDEAGLVSGTHYQWSTDRQLPSREFCTQYNETEWQFVSRLMAEEGLHFHYQHSADKHLMVIGDSKTAFSFVEQIPEVSYKHNSGLFAAGSLEKNEHINQFVFSQNTHSGKSTLRDYNFTTPTRTLEKFSQNELNPSLEDYHYPGNYKTESEAEFYASLQQQRHSTFIKTGTGKSNVQRLRAGRLFTQTDHYYQANNIDQLITHVFHEGKQPQSLDEDTPNNANEGSSYHNELFTIPANSLYRPPLQQRASLIHGEQYAFVTGPEGEEIYVNQYGQVKVQFLWDREGQYDEKTTCWLRTNNELSGNAWGQIMTPRIGQQLLIEFEHGNPDRPLISGRTYNGDSLPPYSLPANKTRSTLKTHSTPGGEGYNEIRYEDKKAQEQIYFHSEKDLDIRCKNDRREHIENTRSLIVDNEQHEHIKVDNHQKISNNHQHKVGNNLSQTIGQKLHIKAGSKILQSAGSEVHIKAASSIKLDAGSEITFKAGGSFVKIDPSGVTISGPKVNLNSGGGPGSASSAAPINPFQAVEADKDKPGQSFKPIAPEAPYQLSQFLFATGAGNERTLDLDKFGGCKPCAEAAQKEEQPKAASQDKPS